VETIKQTYHIGAPVTAVWQALVDPALIDGWGGGPAEMSAAADFEFKLWGGDIHGRNVEVVPNAKLTQEWYGGDWAEPSLVTFELFAEGQGTRLELGQTNVPSEEAAEIDLGWKDFYLGPLKEMLENSE
jgi:uncharacterized protein YndB with AHSA1/START domain